MSPYQHGEVRDEDGAETDGPGHTSFIDENTSRASNLDGRQFTTR
jgi:CTP synthase (UTP-ammonia lyase)